MKINVSRVCLKRVTGMKTFQLRMKIKIKSNAYQRVSALSKSVTGIKTFQKRIKTKVKTNENQHASDLSKKLQRN